MQDLDRKTGTDAIPDFRTVAADHVFQIFEIEDKLEELLSIANTAATFAKNVTEEENHPSYGNYIDPEDWIKGELFPFLRTVRFRLPEIHSMITGLLKQCEEGCTLGKDLAKKDPNEGLTPVEIAETEAARKRSEHMQKQIFDMCEITRLGGKSDADLERMGRLGRALRETPEKVQAFIDSLPEPNMTMVGAEIDTSGEWLAPSCVLCINEDEKARFSEE